MLNALRHQRVGSASTNAPNVVKVIGCSTLYGIRGLDQIRSHFSSSNAFGMCSTPYGIRGLDQVLIVPQDCAQPHCAQRLTASEGWISPPPMKPEISFRVLNALRHQRVGSSGRALEYCLHRGVLNALRHQRVGSARRPAHSNSFTALCSTPYGIRGLDQRERVKSRPELSVCSTPYGIRGLDQTMPVVNKTPCDWTCSTPYGIRGLDQYPDGRHWQSRHRVLNALRHQRVGSVTTDTLTNSAVGRCSTPYGIRGLDQGNGTDIFVSRP